MTTRHEVCPTTDLEPGDRRIVEVDGLSVGIFNLDGEYVALNNVCPHQLAPLCQGELTGTTTADAPGEFGSWCRDGEIVRCPWHGWEFDVRTGESLFNPHLQTRTFETAVEAPTTNDEDATEDSDSAATYGAALHGDEPPVDTYEVEVESEMVVVYV